MKRTELTHLLTTTGLELLDSLAPYTSGADLVRIVGELHKQGHPPELITAVMTQSRLRAKAKTKFGDFAQRMLFTAAGLEQATRLEVAAQHAERFRNANLNVVADLGCGIGSDALAFASLDLRVKAVEIDEITAAIASYNLAPFVNASVDLGDAASWDYDSVDAVYLDPARRTAGHSNTARLTNPEDYSPALPFAFEVAKKKPTGIKLGPGFNRSEIPDNAEAQWISCAGEVVELGLWFGELARPGIRRSALVLTGTSRHEMNSSADSEDADVGALGEYLYEPDGSVIRARLIGKLADMIGAKMVSPQIAYLSSSTLVDTPFASVFRIREKLPYQPAALKKIFRERNIGTLEIKKRGVDVDPALLRKQLALRGQNSATLIITRVHGRHTALLAERV